MGSHLVEELLRRNWDVRIIDDLSGGTKLDKSLLKRAILRRTSILDSKAMSKAMSGADTVFHLAAKVSAAESMDEPEVYARVNVAGLLCALDAARKEGVRCFVFPSSAAVYGNDPKLPKTEKSKLDPRSPYAVTKILGEALCRVYFEEHDLGTVSLRLFNIYGSRQKPSSPYSAVIPKFIAALSKGQRPTVFGDGSQTRDFVHIQDVVRAMMLAAGVRRARGEVFNIASGRGTSLLELLDTLSDVGGWKVNPRFVTDRAGDVRFSRASIAKARRILGYRPTVTLKEGLSQLTK